MTSQYQKIEQRLREKWPEAVIQIEDVRGDGAFLCIRMGAVEFSGIKQLARHRQVHKWLCTDQLSPGLWVSLRLDDGAAQQNGAV